MSQQCPRPELGVIPKRLRHLPIDRGYPVPWFVEWSDGAPEFRAMSVEKFARAIKEKRCWVCGDILGRYLSFVVGPMCVINMTSAEPPCHHDCAVWSARHCPFLSRPHMARREDNEINTSHHGDASITRNPGCAAVLTTKVYKLFKAPGASAIGWLIKMGRPERIEWFAEGRTATRAEVETSIDTGLPLLEALCEHEATPALIAGARAELQRLREASTMWLPAGS